MWKSASASRSLKAAVCKGVPSRPRRGAKRKVGRPSKGPTVYVGMRLPKELHQKVKELRRQTDELLTQSAALEKLIFDGLEAQKR